MFNKKGIQKGILFSLVCIVLFSLVVIATPPGIVNDIKITETGEGVTSIDFYANTTTDEWVYPYNVTLYANVSSSDSDRNTGLQLENLTVDLTNLVNGSSNLSNLVETINFELSELFLDGGAAAGQYVHYSFYACGENDTSYGTTTPGAINNTECAWSVNSSIYINPVNYPSRTAPTVDIISPLNGNDDDGFITFNISATATDTQTMEGGNIAIYLNWSGAGDQTGCGSTSGGCEVNSNVTLVLNETIALTTTDTFATVTFNETALFGGRFDSNTTIFFTGYACNNGTTTGNCSFATSNITRTISYTVEETTAPTITGFNYDNGTVIADNDFNLSFTVADNVLVKNVTIWLNGTATTYDKDTEVTYIQNTTLDVDAASATGTWFNMSDMISNDTWSEFAAPTNDGFLYYYVEVSDNASSVTYSDNFTIEFDSTAPTYAASNNYSITNGSCQTATVDFEFNEPSNYSLLYYKTELGVNANSTLSSSTVAANHSVDLTQLISNTDYTYNFTEICDAHGNCGTTSDYDGLETTFTFDWSLCTGWSHYGILTSETNLSQLAIDTNSDYTSWWNESNQAFATYTRASPALGNDHAVGRGEGVLFNKPENGVWVRTYDGNMTVPDNEGVYNGTDVNFVAEWTMFGLLVDRTPENITYGQNPSISASADNSTIDFISAFNNNNSESVYRDYIPGRTLNANMTAPMMEGFAPWIYMNLSTTWANRTGFEDIV